ncbi:putative membrane protein YdbT with pleckstrin-like domain [Nocardioides zeae]|uniref:Membrane protein YdbT with pleckstrin-like domain n=1 Tax=Nocardioides zeae TaxID=1457234 RepID=A0ACC6IFT7_9ACTN|nr:PH domain-containing protein [Nocardioides zeae]MDR6176619.1 putative membrane protein YdbT with pleckstrin-like domain [Nocardioides zeae]MDR6209631.1 putative membrane protein YdbT with pleckstrin-like domain [Nocardioides zeae]
MSFPQRLLNPGEHVVVSTRTHVKELFGPAAVLLLAIALGVVATVSLPEQTAANVLEILVWVAVVATLVWFVLRPLVGWLTTTYTFTNRRFIARSGFIAKEGRTIPLNRISGVDFEIGVVDRIFGCGTLVVSDASEQGRVELTDIPRVEKVQLLVSEELHRISGVSHDDGT